MGVPGNFIFLLVVLLKTYSARAACLTDQFDCGNNQCISHDHVCDYSLDCDNGADENNCDVDSVLHCSPPAWFRCSSGRCISALFQCDTENDCGDFSDELNCHLNRAPGYSIVCDPNEFTCKDNSSCANMKWLCDGDKDCEDGSDETFGCLDKNHCDDGLLCKNGKCVPSSFRCDGVDDCGDNSDEAECNAQASKECHRENGLFQCHDGLCIQIDLVCDKFPHCFDQTDEIGCESVSNVSCASFGCSHNCHITPQGPQCLCQNGYVLDNDTKTCIDFDECAQYGTCGQKCSNSPGSFQCSCDRGYVLQKDDRSCKVAGIDPILLFAADNQIRGIYLENEVYFVVAQGLQQVTAVTYDGHDVFWANINVGEESIVRSGIMGDNRKVIVDSGLGLPEDMDIDFVTGNIYFTDSEKKHIGVCKKDGSACTVIVNQDVDKPRAISLLPQKGIMFWSDWGEKPMIATSGMDGSNPKSLVDKDISWPNGLAVDFSNNRLYWVDAKFHHISSIRLDGSDRREVLRNLIMRPFSISVFEDSLYWSDWISREVQKCDKFTGKNITTLYKEKVDLVFGLHVYHPALHPHVDNPCLHDLCDDLCLLAPNNSYTCKCTEEKELLPNLHSCHAAPKKNHLAMVTDDSLHLFSKPTLGKHVVPQYFMPNVQSVSAIAYNAITDSIIISDSIQKRILSYDVNYQQTTTLISLGVGSIISMSHDSYTDNLYACDDETRALVLWSLRTKASKEVVRYSSGHRPLSVAVAADERLLYVAVIQLSEEVHITKVYMNGKGASIPVITGSITGSPVYLSYDVISKRVYWYNPFFKAIESVNANGTNRDISFVLSGAASSFAVFNNTILCTLEDQPRLYVWTVEHGDRYINIPDIKWGKSLQLTPMWKTENNHACVSTAHCSHLCFAESMSYTCACPTEMHLASDNKTCLHQVSCSDNEFQCMQDFMCISRVLRCDGHKDCPSGQDEEDCEFGTCRDDQFKCNNGQCISKSKMCDFHFDCADHSDEVQCKSKCKETEFPCGSGECIFDLWVCDRNNDCADGSDEKVCDVVTCGSGQFKCKSGTCISAQWECDGELDCVDGSDEHENCRKTICDEHEFKCKNRVCVDKKLKCDGYDDCGDNSDEEGCSDVMGVFECSQDEFLCSSISTLCVPHSARCNFTAECPRGEDETDCAFCHRGEFQCKNKRCVTKRWLCDGENDCGDNSDEHVSHCHASAINGQPKKLPCEGFQCSSGECIPRHLACNGVSDCADGGDEGGRCATACNDANCQHTCNAQPTGAFCECKTGFVLNVDGHSCDDVDECIENRCSQICINTPGSFKCDCEDGYALKNDRVTCKAKGEKLTYIVGSENEVKKISEDLNHADLLLYETGHHILGIDVDAKRNVLYWTSAITKALNVYKIDDGSRSFMSTHGHPGKISLDWVTGNAYFIDRSSTNKIIACNMVHRKCTTVLTIEEAAVISDLIFDPLSGYLFYAKAIPSGLRRPYSKIFMFDKAENNATLLASFDVTWVSGMTLDHVRKVLYWADLQQQVIEKIRLNGMKRELVFREGVHRPVSLTLFENSLYWLNKGSGEMTKCDVYGEHKGKCEKKSLHLYDAKLLVLKHIASQPQVANPCANLSCPAGSMCLITPKGGKCFCEDGTLINDDTKCAESNEAGFALARSNTGELMENIVYRNNGTSIFLAVLITMLAMIGAIAGYTFYSKTKSNSMVLESFYFRNPTYGMSHVPCEMHHSALSPGQHEYVNQAAFVKHPNGNLAFLSNEEQGSVNARVYSLKDSESDCSEHYQDIDMKANLIP